MAIVVPESRNLPYPLTSGKEIIIEGLSQSLQDWFSINLTDGPTLDSRIVFHFSVRFGEETVVRNHKEGDWGEEERHGGFPFEKGQRYKIKILARDDVFLVIVNGHRFCEFSHRLPMESAQFLYITEGTDLYRIHFAEGVPEDAENPPVPHTVAIPGGIYPGMAILVSGVPNEGLDRFNVNLVCGSNFNSDDVALTMDVRFDFGHDRKCVVRNSKSGGDWSNEETDQEYFPFEEGVEFDIAIYVEETGFKVKVNHQDFIWFNHRIQPPERANHLHIEGNVRLMHVRFQ